MQTLIFATNNHHKVEEVRSVLKNIFTITSLKEAGINKDIPEPYSSLEENAREKSTVIHALTGKDCFSEDTGLEVDALHGQPGVKSARYAGEEADSKKNIQKLLNYMTGKAERNARFRTVISLIFNKKEYLFEGICTGKIIELPKGENGFGYDPVFIPDGAEKTFAEMDMDEKNKYSHRKKAIEKLIHFLTQHHGKDKI
ncbi:MAG: RdgB/HAM1 family non-canonical purine NTP pyrophosphatase [Niastella sp.]|nr:RdgB/HAM1 family non-canonical purine NTP pyrophosphatase [Niastella sp.]